jgi:rhodanese-related sulfurtransferase
MAQKIVMSSKALVDAAKSQIEEIAAADAVQLAGSEGVVLVDIRDPREVERDGKVPGAFHCTRGMLEFWIDPESVYYKPIFGEDKKFVFFCAGGLRSALAAKTAKDMGLKPVAHVIGGYKAWKEAGGPTEAYVKKGG